jgi:hypothetical protein
LERTVAQAHEFLSKRFGDAYEIILIPNPPPGRHSDRSVEASQALAARYPNVVVVPHFHPPGKGAAIRSGVFRARGRWIFFTDADLPYDLEFFDWAADRLNAGFHLVNGNRRISSSHFDVPVSLLPLAYQRHRLGMAFNRFVRLLLPVRTTDTQAGIKAMSRELALAAFGSQSCPGFFFDLEIFLSAQARGFRQIDGPVTLYLNSEKSTVRVLRESILAGFWLARIFGREICGKYDGRPASSLGIWTVARLYASARLGTRLFLTLRTWLTPYEAMVSHLPKRGRILDSGCGHGLLSLTAALTGPEREIHAIDHDDARVAQARVAIARANARISIQVGNILSPPIGEFDAITLIDVMHYFTPELQSRILQGAFERLRPGGRALIREIDPRGLPA